MATGSSEATSPDTGFGIKDISALHEALCPVSAKYKFFGLQIGVDINKIKEIEATYKNSSDCLLEILLSHLYQEQALTCADICKALRSQTVNMPQLTRSFKSHFKCELMVDQHKKIEEESGKKKRAEGVSESAIPLRMSEKESERIKRTEYVESKNESSNESNSDESENINKSAEEERQRGEPKSERTRKRAREKEQCVSNEQPEPDELKRDEMKGSKKKKVSFSAMAAGRRIWAESDQKGNKSMMDTNSESELSDTYTNKEVYSESDKYKDPQKDTEKMKSHQKQDSVMKQHSNSKKTARFSAKLDSDDDQGQLWQPKRLKTMEIECETESCSTNTSYESDSETPKPTKIKQFSHEDYSAPQFIASRGKLQKPHYQLKEKENISRTDLGVKEKISVTTHCSEQSSGESQTDCENEKSDSGNDSSEDREDSKGKSSVEEEKTETDEESSTAPSEEEVKKREKKRIQFLVKERR